VAARHGDRIDRLVTQFVGYLLEVCLGTKTQINGLSNGFEHFASSLW